MGDNAVCAHGVLQSLCGQCEADLEQEAYAALADEMNDPDAGPWVEADWDEEAVRQARVYASRHGLRWPPGTGDFDRWHEAHHG